MNLACTTLAHRPLETLDLLIAAHALAASAVLVTNDPAFSQVAHLQIEDWTAELP